MNEPNLNPRPSEASNSVVRAISIGTPTATVLGYLSAILAEKYRVPPEVMNAGTGLLISAGMGLIQYFSRGGRKGESH